ncbi:hypothetical protein [Maridesulfovibrio ferrireducens]|uniref:hypothetical protein n=1 Tax=Maridesulfovibrio ferrireducens TaxID=246191 RepID=UPI001A303447|nr:hypothetical protein [Maridesulfovibrio ferrireducens]MBI9113234.1 hypothetical protein [Maridesulfovibrio ferrireducens]
MNYKYFEVVDAKHKELVKKELLNIMKDKFGDSFDTIYEDLMENGSVLSYKYSAKMIINYCIEEDRVLYKTTAGLNEKGGGLLAPISEELYNELVEDDEGEE